MTTEQRMTFMVPLLCVKIIKDIWMSVSVLWKCKWVMNHFLFTPACQGLMIETCGSPYEELSVYAQPEGAEASWNWAARHNRSRAEHIGHFSHTGGVFLVITDFSFIYCEPVNEIICCKSSSFTFSLVFMYIFTLRSLKNKSIQVAVSKSVLFVLLLFNLCYNKYAGRSNRTVLNKCINQ